MLSKALIDLFSNFYLVNSNVYYCFILHFIFYLVQLYYFEFIFNKILLNLQYV